MKTKKITLLFALQSLQGIGSQTIKKILALSDSPEDFLREDGSFKRLPGLSPRLKEILSAKPDMKRVENEFSFIEKNKIRVLVYDEPEFPERLLHCHDSPLLLFVRGNTLPAADRCIAFVGTRKSTAYGKEITRRLIEGLAPYNPMIISGLAAGIDSIAHQAALDFGLSTCGVVAHGLHMLYPAANRQLAVRIESSGCVVSEYLSGTPPDRENFPMRNRIIAGLSDAVTVIEAATTGGALITARIADSYNREVFAVPGRLTDTFSGGCNSLIRNHLAIPIEKSEDIADNLNWSGNVKKTAQLKLFPELTEAETAIVQLLESQGEVFVDDISTVLELSPQQTLVQLFNLEMKGVVKALPGKIYSVC